MKLKKKPEIFYFHWLDSKNSVMGVLQANESVILVAERQVRDQQRFLVALNQEPGKYDYIKHSSVLLEPYEKLTLYSPINGAPLTHKDNPDLAQLETFRLETQLWGNIVFATDNGVQATKLSWDNSAIKTWGKDALKFWPEMQPTLLPNQKNKAGWAPTENDYCCPHCNGFVKIKASVLLKAEGLLSESAGLVLLSDQPGDYEYYKSNLFRLKDQEGLKLSCPICQTNLAHPEKTGMAYLKIRHPKKGEGTIYFATRNGEHATFIEWNNGKTEYFGDHQNEFMNFFGASMVH